MTHSYIVDTTPEKKAYVYDPKRASARDGAQVNCDNVKRKKFIETFLKNVK